MLLSRKPSRRHLLAAAAAPAFLRAQGPALEQGVMAGDVIPGRAMIWSRATRPGTLKVRWGTTEAKLDRAVTGPAVTAATDLTGRVELTGLPAGQRIVYEASIVNGATGNGAPVRGTFVTPPADRAKGVKLIWGGDVCGQGWGIDKERGGMKMFDTLHRAQADLFVHSGDSIYADGPLAAEVPLPDGTVWRNVMTEEKSKVAETLAEFRGNHRYNLLDENVRRFNAGTAQVWQWDDHEVLNNWSSAKDLSHDPRYTEKDIRKLAARARQAFLEYAPLRPAPASRIYRHIPYGPLLDVFVIDMRTYRGPNTFNRETAEIPFLGRPQVDWLIQGLRNSRATWKVIAADMPLGFLIGDGPDEQGRPKFEAIANGPGPALGRELETARLLQAMKAGGVRNTVWITADMHYTAAHHYHPDRAQFKDFLPFWEFLSGPLHAGTFGPSTPDNTFGVEVAFQKHPPRGMGGMPPSMGLQFFGELSIAPGAGELTVNLRDMTGASLYKKDLAPE